VPASGVVQSPVLVGRDAHLALLARRLDDAAAGRGQLMFVAGEAGIGKTRLLGVLARQAGMKDFAIARAAAFPGDTQSLGGLLLDLASDVAAADAPALRRLGQDLGARVRAMPADGDAHHRRRLLVQEVTDQLATAGSGGPLLIVLEDLHWADELSLEILGHLAGRIAGRPVLVAGAYRSDELYPRLPMRELRARLLSQRQADEIRLQRLGLEQTATMTSATIGQQVPAQVVAAIYARSDGIPLHVEEILAAIGQGVLTIPDSSAAVQAAAVPDTLGDAVLTRTGRLDERTRRVTAAAAVIGRSFDFDLLTAVTGASPDEVAAALRELQDAYLVVPSADAASFDFRHALIRDALYADTALPLRRRLHERTAQAAVSRGYPDSFVSAHFEQAANPGLAYRHAIAAAAQSASLSAHREALDLYRRAARNQPPDLPVLEQAELFAAVGDEAAAADDNDAAAEAYQTAHDLAAGAGDRRVAAALVPRMAAVAHLRGEQLDVRLGMLQAALDSVGQAGGAERVRIRLLSAMAADYMLARRLDLAIDYGYQAQAAEQFGDDKTAFNSAVTLASALVFAGRMTEGWTLLEDTLSRARAAHQEEETARGYRMICSSASVLVEYDRAERWLGEGIRYASQVELWNHRHYMAAHLAHVQWATGQWDAAELTARAALADGRGGITTQITAQYVLGYLALGRGDWDAAGSLLGEALATGERMAELQRLSPPLWGLAEAARCRGDHAAAIALCERGYAASVEVDDAAYAFPFLLTGVRAHLARGGTEAAQAWSDRIAALIAARAIPGTMPAIGHGQGLILLARGNTAEAYELLDTATRAWRARRRCWEGAWALLDLASAAAQARRRGEAARLIGEALAVAPGAAPLTDAADQLSQSLDHGQPADPWHPLSAREFEVARLVAAGLTNRQIAEQLILSPKTISAHITHILTKLGAARRAEIAAWCATIPTDPPHDRPGRGRPCGT
jgi:DNA-binding CsgD family transcriptional regulator